MRELLKVPNEKLRWKSEPVKEIDGFIKALASYMESQLEPLKAAGFSAPQFGELVRLIVVRVDQMTNLAIVNPEVVKETDSHLVVEGCTSIPGKLYYVERPKIAKVRGFNLDGEEITLKGRDFLAQVLRHECDHLDGVLIDSIGELVIE